MQRNKFAHLHVHTEFSLLDGSSKIKELLTKTKELGMDSIAITDHGVMFGVIDFYKTAKELGIKPILGCEVYVASGSRNNKKSDINNFYYHLVLLAENNTGYNNLIKLVSKGFTEGFYYKPRIDFELLQEYSEGLIALSACLGGVIAKNILNFSYEKALEECLKYKSLFGDNFYLELQDHGIDEQKLVNKQLIRMSEETGVSLVATNDLHYVNKEDVEAHDLLLCIKTNTNINDENRLRYHGGQFYLKSPEEMYEIFSYIPKALDNTVKIAQKCNVEIIFNEYKLPKYGIKNGMDASEYLQFLCNEGLIKKYEVITRQLEERMNYELGLIKQMGFVDYFLIVWDFIRYAKENNITVGPGRGSAAGSIVAYCLDITNIDPIKYNLIFERFLNPDRISMPDIDIDFCYERRQEVIEYVIEKYGSERVAQIITFGTMAAKASIRDVGRALAIPYADVDRIAKMIPFELGMTIEKALKINSELNEAYMNETTTRHLIDMSMKLEGLTRHASTHAAGVIISDLPITSYVPLYEHDGVVTTQFSMGTLEDLGLLKMDFLGLRTLTVIQNAVEEINRNHNINLNIDKIDFEDKSVYDMISKGKTEGVFQLESTGMKAFMKELQPESIEDIIAGISLFRPGPMDFIPKYIKGKRNYGNIKYTHESLEPILNTTYGCIVYQEQVMQIVRDLAGYSLGRSDLLRRVMSKKKTSEMDKERNNFIYGLDGEIPGCVKNGIDSETAEIIFDEMIDFAKYAFNKSHAAAYAVIGYQTAWLKVHYQVEFMAALMTSVMDNTSKIAEYISESVKININLLPPDINEGYKHFSVSDNSIRFGLLAIKNVGQSIIDALVDERNKNGKFTSLTNFIKRMSDKDLNKRCVESLIKCGAFDSLGGSRMQYMIIYKNILNGITANKRTNIEGQISLFDTIIKNDDIDKDELPEADEYTLKELLSFEKEIMGIYISGHPLSEYKYFLEKYVDTTSLDLIADNKDNLQINSKDKLHEDKVVSIGGIIVQKSIKYTRDNKAMAFLTIEDFYGKAEVILFSKVYEKYMNNIKDGDVVIIIGKVSFREDEDSKILCNKILFYNESDNNIDETLWLKISMDKQIDLNYLKNIISSSCGETPVIIYNEKERKKISLDTKHWVKLNDNLIIKLKSLLGEDAVKIVS